MGLFELLKKKKEKKKEIELIFYPSPNHNTTSFVEQLKEEKPDILFLEAKRLPGFENALNEYLKTGDKETFLMVYYDFCTKLITTREVKTYFLHVREIVKKRVVLLDMKPSEYLDFKLWEASFEEREKLREKRMAERILDYIKETKESKFEGAVVIGAGHLRGILRHLNNWLEKNEEVKIHPSLWDMEKSEYIRFESIDECFEYLEKLKERGILIFNFKPKNKEEERMLLTRWKFYFT